MAIHLPGSRFGHVKSHVLETTLDFASYRTVRYVFHPIDGSGGSELVPIRKPMTYLGSCFEFV